MPSSKYFGTCLVSRRRSAASDTEVGLWYWNDAGIIFFLLRALFSQELIFSAAYCTARTILWYPVHLHTLPDNPSLISSSDGL